MTGPADEVEVFFDFLSPYSWLALRECETLSEGHFVPRPVVYGVVLDAEGVFGPGETPRKRRQAMQDVARIAALRGLELAGPPAHPFRSLDALRVAVMFEDEPALLALCARLADAAWAHGRDLTDVHVLSEVVASVGLSPSDLAARVAAQSVKDRLRDLTGAAIDAGVCGVPTFRHGDRLFHGQDRIEHVLLSLRGQLPEVEDVASRLISRPAAVRRVAMERRGRAPD